MKKNSCLLVTLLLLFGMYACTKANEDQLSNPAPGAPGTPGAICDTVNMKYATDIIPILQQHCYGCHGKGSTGGSGGISLDGYAALKSYADNGFLKGNITHAPGYIGMPYGQPKLDDCTIAKVVDWINNGAQNN